MIYGIWNFGPYLTPTAHARIQHQYNPHIRRLHLRSAMEKAQ